MATSKTKPIGLDHVAKGHRRERAHADGTLKWWQRAVFYEITPISFQDSNGDGKGDIEGLISRIDYLEWLGIDAVWLTPIFRSPMLDLGYDITDFCDVDRVFGTMEDVDRLITVLHKRQIRVILDFVPNHTSAQHPWFQESRSSRTNPKRDWYVWASEGANGGPPNNWLSRFGLNGSSVAMIKNGRQAKRVKRRPGFWPPCY